MTVLDRSNAAQGASVDPEVLIREARRMRRRRYRRNIGLSVVTAVVLASAGALIALGNGGDGRHRVGVDSTSLPHP